MKMPDLSANEAEIAVVRWLIETGQPVKRGQPLVEVQTDKAVMEVEAIATGTLAEICAKPEENVKVGQVIAVIEVTETAV
jgi:pyruvate/2-oxoglutarate dehydrogenase complex dihydrolipoamide acyltransferase (E2) component